MTSLTLSAPAKVNLFLKVLNKRKDGYHNIFTLFERISLADRITISKRASGIEVVSDRFITADPKDNLAYKAAELMVQCKGSRVQGPGSRSIGVRIAIKKRIPITAGLGGGSSDAASVLLGINKLYNLRLGRDKLMKLAGRLGADVPFFILNAPFAIGKYKGDRLKKVNTGLRLWHLIIYPGPKPSTRRIYEAFDRLSKHLTSPGGDDKINRILRRPVDFNSAESMLYNNLEETVVSKNPVTGDILRRLAHSTGRKAVISGSGPSVFCLLPSRKEAMEARKKFLRSAPAAQRRLWQVFMAKTSN